MAFSERRVHWALIKTSNKEEIQDTKIQSSESIHRLFNYFFPQFKDQKNKQKILCGWHIAV